MVATIHFLFILIPLLIILAYVSLIERKVMASIQRRRGPNVVGFFGLLQPISDGVKLFLKEVIVPNNADRILFVLAPVFSFVISLIGWGLIPFSTEIHGINVYFGLLFSLAISSLGVYGVIVSGWSSNSKYAFLGAIRAAAQMLSYELTLSFSVLPVIIVSGSLNYIEIVAKQNAVWFIVPLLPAGIIFLISALAETNRTPFDLPEAEGELVAGFNVEYSSMTFALFFLAEYSNIVMISALFVILFLGGWTCFGMASSLFFAIKICALIYLFVWIRAMLPRYRFDQLLELGWKVLLPLTMSYFLLVSGTLLFTVNL